MASCRLAPRWIGGSVARAAWSQGSHAHLWWFFAAMVLVVSPWSAIPSGSRADLARLVAGVVLAGALAASPLMFRCYPSRRGLESRLGFRVPFDGPIAVAWGGGTPDVNYHVVAPDQRWAYDLVVTREGATHRGDGTTLGDYFVFGRDVLAPCAGTVHAVSDGAPDMPPGKLGGRPAGGNQIVLHVAANEYLFLCHLSAGSIQVRLGEAVTEGQVVARIGNSGNTSEPHLHVHLQDTPRDNDGDGIPMPFSWYRSGDRLVERGIPTGGFDGGRTAGEIVEHVGPSATAGGLDDP